MTLRRSSVVVTASIALLAAAAASMALGAVHVPLANIWDALTGQAEEGPLRQIIVELRLPRTVSACIVGAALGVAGALLQGALANPLASPDVIGVTGGAATSCCSVKPSCAFAESLLKITDTPAAAHPRRLAPPTRLTCQRHASLLAGGPRHPRLHHIGRTDQSSTDS